ncbi:ATP synthase subunit B [Weizmannia acidilactici]|uniref:ATP synthase subunit B n=1 Tax=Weizmannia acidilactici TaxID=2607726 RepID=A0A5J4J7Q6_9BACI|nr:phasin family protein [Weizmannia acidilactici]GER68103.1 ATP synthase subunit B [Weizmannia acidilactici]GER70946.1 ATP synthase subunit B [Weizmannia acidilactici]GER73939.1 ATP synthase subunit B [Weizmannia acidilactici]
MLDRMNQLLSLGLGMAVVSKEQVEKAVNRLVEKGNLTKAESKQLIDELLEKGEQSKQELNEAIKERVNQILSEMNVATKDEIKALELRIQQLEERLNP